MMPESFYAHTLGENTGDWEVLEDHLQRVARLAADSADTFRSSEWGRLAGLWHDLGKYHDSFQQYLRTGSPSHPHSGAGAAFARERNGESGLYLAWVIAGHHAGLANPAAGIEGGPRALRDRLMDALKVELPGTLQNAPAHITSESIPPPPDWTGQKPGESAEDARLRVELWLRFLFSALIDADRLATEAFCNPEMARLRPGCYDTIPVLRERIESHLDDFMARIPADDLGRPINRARREISDSCAVAAQWEPGLFSLTVPTGGGKTLAAMRFALRHAETHGLRRVIVVIPFTSIIEQNAARYTEILGAGNVLEHHSNLDTEKSALRHGEQLTARHELAAENWDAPVIVTTTVQFFESLLTNHPSRARKVHNIAGSVIVLDEVQSLPVGYLKCLLDVLGQLATHYRCSVVLSTATPPALRKRETLPDGLTDVREIIGNPRELSAQLRRVRYEWPDPDADPVQWDDLALRVSEHSQILAVVHRRADAWELARRLAQLVDPGSVFHLSALMCPAHRTEVLGRVCEALENKRPCRLVSTQLIEAGVDVDFPVVFRAMAGLDSVVQAAGRCNREGKLQRGRVVVFTPPTEPPPGTLRDARDVARIMLRAASTLDADDPDVQEEYFRRLHAGAKLDARHIQRERRGLNFATVARDFRMIEDAFTRPVVIPWGEGADRVDNLTQALARLPFKNGEPGTRSLRLLYRALQPFTVSVHEKAFQAARSAGAIEEPAPGLAVLSRAHLCHYSDMYGLRIGDDIAVADPTAFIT